LEGLDNKGSGQTAFICSGGLRIESGGDPLEFWCSRFFFEGHCSGFSGFRFHGGSSRRREGREGILPPMERNNLTIMTALRYGGTKVFAGYAAAEAASTISRRVLGGRYALTGREEKIKVIDAGFKRREQEAGAVPSRSRLFLSMYFSVSFSSDTPEIFQGSNYGFLRGLFS